MHTLEKKVLQTLTGFSMVKKGDTVLVALSGGPDSVCLLRVLLGLSDKLGITVAAAHLNHKIRGKAADADEAFVRSLTKKYNVRLVGASRDVPAAAKKKKMSLEEAAREERYVFLRKAADKTGARAIATGHTADDQAETLLMNLLRGTGRTGLTGIDPVREGDIIRPLLQVRKKDILAYLKEIKQDFKTDATNTCLDMTRNRIRHRLLPYLKRNHNPRVDESLARTGAILGAEEAYLERETERIFNGSLKKTNKNKIVLDKRKLLRYNFIFVRRIVRRSLRLLNQHPQGITFTHTESILGLLKEKGNRIVCLPGTIRVEIRNDEIIFLKDTTGKRDDIPLAVPGETLLWEGVRVLTARVLKPGAIQGTVRDTPSHTALIDLDRVKGPLKVRTRRDGDRITPLGLNGSKKLKDFLIDRKISRLERDRLPLVTDGSTIVWAAGVRLAHPYRVTGRTTSILKIKLTEA